MKITLRNHARAGYATVMVMGLLALLFVVVAANSRNVNHLYRELQLLEQRQTEHWQYHSASTNAAPSPHGQQN